MCVRCWHSYSTNRQAVACRPLCCRENTHTGDTKILTNTHTHIPAQTHIHTSCFTLITQIHAFCQIYARKHTQVEWVWRAERESFVADLFVQALRSQKQAQMQVKVQFWNPPKPCFKTLLAYVFKSLSSSSTYVRTFCCCWMLSR